LGWDGGKRVGRGGEGGGRGDLKSEKCACFPTFNYKYTKKKRKEKKVIANWNRVWHTRVVVDVEIVRSAKFPRASLLVPSRGLQGLLPWILTDLYDDEFSIFIYF
jgi:hypothetical protein